MECNLNRTEIVENVKNAMRLCGEKTRIDIEALNAIKDVLKHCENHTFHFSDKEDDDENLTVNVYNDQGVQENHLVDSIRVEDNGAVLINCNGEDYWTWETDKSVTEFYQYLIDEIESEFDQMYNS